MAYTIINQLAFLIGLMGVAIILWGVFNVFFLTLKTEYRGLRQHFVRKHRDVLRHSLGVYLLLGLEFLVAADIVRSMIHPTLQEIATLGAIVLIRTVIGYTLGREMVAFHSTHDSNNSRNS